MDLVSAIITTHNRKALLTRAIESVFNQTYKDIECIVVDDASTDGTNLVCKDSRIKYIYIPKEKSRGGNYARNLGIKNSAGKYCAFLDDDDFWLPSKIEKQMLLINQMDCELVYCGSRQEIVIGETVVYKDLLPSKFLCGDLHTKILQYICTTTTNILVNKQALIEIDFFDEDLKFWQEYELTIRLAQRKPFYFVNEPLSVYRIDKSDKHRLTNRYFEWRSAVKYIRNKHSSLYKKLTLTEKLNALGLIWLDSSIRCNLAGLHNRALFYFVLSIPYRFTKWLHSN